VLLSSYPTKHARIGNAVGLDTPASAVRLLGALADAGYLVGEVPNDPDALIHALIAAGGHDVEWLTDEQLAAATARVPLAAFRRWFAALPEGLRERMRSHWGEPPGQLYVDGHDIVLASLRFGNVILMIQPPRGFGENPVAIYHDPDLPPSHHYLAGYRWLAEPESAGGFGAHAVVHLGKHGTLEWLPGKGLGLGAGCAPDAVLGDLPLVYPFIVNDPGEGTQAKRRAHATVVDHMVPPMARAETYGDLARLEQLLDEYATVAALDPAKLPTVRAQVWELVNAAQLHHDLHTDQMPGEEAFDDFVLHLDGYLCEIKDVQIRDGLHVLGRVHTGEARINLVLSVLRARQIWGGAHALPGLRQALGEHFGLCEPALLAEPGARVAVPRALTDLVDGPAVTAADAVDLIETLARRLVTAMEDAGWKPAAVAGVVAAAGVGTGGGDIGEVLRFAATEVVPRLAGATAEVTGVLAALDGRFVPPGPSGSPTRGLVNVLPTGRNFYSVDPKAIPSRNAWDVGWALAGSLLARHLADTGAWPTSVGLTIWGTSAMRTQGDDIAEVLALLGCRPVWDDRSRRVTGFEVIDLAELGRPRIDVTIRISASSGRSARRSAARRAVTLVAGSTSGGGQLRRAGVAALASQRPGAPPPDLRLQPGAYRAGLPRPSCRELAHRRRPRRVYGLGQLPPGGASTGGRRARTWAGVPAHRRVRPDWRHDIADSDGYFPYRWDGCVVRHLTGSAPAAVRRRLSLHAVNTEPAGDRRAKTRWSLLVACAGTVQRRSSWQPRWTTCSATTRPPGSSTTGCTSTSPPAMWTTRRPGRSWTRPTRGRCAGSWRGCWRPPTGDCGSGRSRRRSSGCARRTCGPRVTWRATRDRIPVLGPARARATPARAAAQRDQPRRRRRAGARREGHGQVDGRAGTGGPVAAGRRGGRLPVRLRPRRRRSGLPGRPAPRRERHADPAGTPGRAAGRRRGGPGGRLAGPATGPR
jgi:cobaltochelatase CobN